MKNNLYIFFSSILAGMCIAIGVTVYLSTMPYNKVLGTFLFALGLFTIMHFGLHLFTGKIGLTLDHKPSYLITMVFCLLGNIVGAFVLASIIKLTRINPTLVESAQYLVNSKMNDTWYSIFILSFMCGILIYIAYKGHTICPYDMGKVIFAFLAIVIFILCSYEHCVANVAYFTFAGVFNLKVVGYFLLMVLGNSVGAILLDGALKVNNILKNRADE